MLDENKAAFILCANDEEKLAEADFYISTLKIPDNMTVEKCYVWDAPSMAAGYNAGMKGSDAKYKFYLHQDVFLLNTAILEDVTALFQKNPSLGMLGMVGVRSDVPDAHYVNAWDIGAMLPPVASVKARKGSSFQAAAAVDGLLMITQYDIPWREDLFSGWDFYDISQCMEFRRVGCRIGVPDQDPDFPWVFHDFEASRLSSYSGYRKTFIEEYQDQAEFSKDRQEADDDRKNREAVLADFYDMLEKLLYEEQGREKAAELLDQYSRTIWGHRELSMIKKARMIYREEKRFLVEESRMFWKEASVLKDLLDNVQRLKFAVKRAEFGRDETALFDLMEKGSCSEIAVGTMAVLTVTQWERFLLHLESICARLNDMSLFERMRMQMKELIDRIFREDPNGLY